MPNYLDLFAGAGGLSEGFLKAGYTPVAHVEMDEAACNTLKTRTSYYWLKQRQELNLYHEYLSGEISRTDFYNHIPQPVLNTVLNDEITSATLKTIFAKIDALLNGRRLDLIVGGPPCQAYSLIGRARDENNMIGDKRNYLYILYAEFLKKYKPTYFVFENVTGLLSAKDGDDVRYFENMRRLFYEYGYATDYQILNAADFGVLQGRKRVILLGIRDRRRRNFFPNIPKESSDCLVREIFSDLPKIKAGGGTVLPVNTLHYEGSYLYRSGIKEYDMEPVTFHKARPHIEQDLKIYYLAVNLWNNEKKRLRYDLLPKELRTHVNTDAFLDRFKVVAGELPFSQTVVAHIARDGHYYIHPDINQNRSLTPREAARLQTFPDNYYFESKKAEASRTLAYQQIGNAVPVRLAWHIATALRNRFAD